MNFLWQTEDSLPVSMVCPACDDTGPHRPILIMPACGVSRSDWIVIQCKDCSTRFSTDREGADYRGDEVPGGPLLDFYLEQGAGLRPMLEPLGWAEPGSGRRMLEIGGGFGFASDFVQTALGWTAKGYDPSGLAALGKEYLGLDIVRDYWTNNTPLSQPFDIAYASEVIEHIPSPGEFLSSIRRAVGEDGIVVLTTPDGAALAPSTPLGMLAPIASPTLHLTLFSAQGLKRSLQKAGFAYVQVSVVGLGLHAFASQRPLPQFKPLDETLYRSYLRQRLDKPGLAPALISGLQWRLFKEFVNSGETAAALELFDKIKENLRINYGIDINNVASLLPDLDEKNVDNWLRRRPGNLPGLLFFRAILANNGEGNAERAMRYAAAASILGGSLRSIFPPGMDDGETEFLTAAAARLFLSGAIVLGADVGHLLTAIEEGDAETGLMLSRSARQALRRDLCRDLRQTRHPHLLWRAISRQPAVLDEVTLLRAYTANGVESAPIPALQAIENASTPESAKAAFDAIWITPGAAEAHVSIDHARKMLLIRLVQLDSHAEAEYLFDAWGVPSLISDEPVANAMALAASMRA